MGKPIVLGKFALRGVQQKLGRIATKNATKAAVGLTKKTAKKAPVKKATALDTAATLNEFLTTSAAVAAATIDADSQAGDTKPEVEAVAMKKKTVKSKVAKGPMKKKPVKSKDVKGAMKKPAAATSKVAKGHMKKPAAATSKSKAALIDLEDDSQSETRDRMKNYYFQEQLKNDTLDPELRGLWDKVRGNRKKETMLVNGVMVKVANGKFKPDKDSPQFQEFHSKITKNFWKDEHKGIPESLAIVKFKGLKFLMEALARGLSLWPLVGVMPAHP